MHTYGGREGGRNLIEARKHRVDGRCRGSPPGKSRRRRRLAINRHHIPECNRRIKSACNGRENEGSRVKRRVATSFITGPIVGGRRRVDARKLPRMILVKGANLARSGLIMSFARRVAREKRGRIPTSVLFGLIGHSIAAHAHAY
jgi:hypothetical protein